MAKTFVYTKDQILPVLVSLKDLGSEFQSSDLPRLAAEIAYQSSDKAQAQETYMDEDVQAEAGEFLALIDQVRGDDHAQYECERLAGSIPDAVAPLLAKLGELRESVVDVASAQNAWQCCRSLRAAAETLHDSIVAAIAETELTAVTALIDD